MSSRVNVSQRETIPPLSPPRVLHPLRLHRPDDVQAHRRRQHAAEMVEKEHARRGFAEKRPVRRKQRPEDGREVRYGAPVSDPARCCKVGINKPGRRSALRENSFHRRKQRPALCAAGTIGDVIGRERVAKLIELGESFPVRRMRGGHKWQCGVPELMPGSLRQTRASRSPSRTSPCCHAASRPDECAKPPVGNAESTSCQTKKVWNGRLEVSSSRPRPGFCPRGGRRCASLKSVRASTAQHLVIEGECENFHTRSSRRWEAHPFLRARP